MTDRYLLASNAPCHEVNPTLWHTYCLLTGRPLGVPSDLWSESAVVEAILSRGLKDRPKQYLD